MKKVTAVVVGVGNRGNVYAQYSLEEPKELEIVGLVDTNDFKIEQGIKNYKVKRENCFKTVDDFIASGLKCDFVINATMDELHYETTMKLLNAKYNLLLEKPIVPNEKQLLNILKASRKNNCKIFVCHVLRYTPFYKGVKDIIDSGTIGTINSMQFNEHVWNVHFVNSFVRGKWRNKKQCGSPLLLAKSCHDMDLICWLNNSTRPTKVVSIGSRKMYTPENAPEGATQYCHECPHRGKCYYDAAFMEAKIDWFPLYTWKNIDKPFKEITMEEKLEYLKHDIMGQCVYKTDMDIVDRQTVSIEFENGSICSFNLIGGTAKINRNLHIVGTLGEIVGELSTQKIYLRTIDTKTTQPIEKEIDFKVVHSDGREGVDSHGGGDYGIMHNVCAYFRGDKVTSAMTKIEDSINSHLVCYAAEVSRTKNKFVKIKEI